jgi:hypothetical protein
MVYNLDELGLLSGARVLWRNPRNQARLRYVWTHAENPQREFFLANEAMIIAVLEAREEDLESTAARFGQTVRTVAKDLPSVFPKLWEESARVNPVSSTGE